MLVIIGDEKFDLNTRSFLSDGFYLFDLNTSLTFVRMDLKIHEEKHYETTDHKRPWSQVVEVEGFPQVPEDL